MKGFIRFVLFNALLALAFPALADNLVVNGGWETGDFTGWNVVTDHGFIRCLPDVLTLPHSGNCHLVSGPISQPGSFSQDLLTSAGESYTLDFWLAHIYASTNSFEAYWNGSRVLALNNLPNTINDYTHYVVGGLDATGPLTTLEFRLFDPTAAFQLDDIGVTSENANVPEPSTLLLLGTGLLSFVTAAWRRRK